MESQMKANVSRSGVLFLVAGLILGLAIVTPARSAILTFEDAPFEADPLEEIDQAYGDNLTAADLTTASYGDDGNPTPNVAASYTNVTWNKTDVTPGLDALGGHTFPDPGDEELVPWSYTFTAESGFLVTLVQFDIGSSAATDYDWSVIDGANNTLASGTVTTAGNDWTLTTVDVGTDITASEVILSLVRDDPDGQGFVAVDNVQFTQSIVVIPTPAALPAGFGLLVLAALRKSSTIAGHDT